MAVTSPLGLDNSLGVGLGHLSSCSTDITTVYFDANTKDYNYVTLKVRNLGQEPVSYLTEAKLPLASFAPASVEPLLGNAMCQSAARKNLQNLHDDYQRKQLLSLIHI